MKKKRLAAKIMLLLGALAYAIMPGIFTVAAVSKVVYDNKVELEKRIEILESEIKQLRRRNESSN